MLNKFVAYIRKSQNLRFAIYFVVVAALLAVNLASNRASPLAVSAVTGHMTSLDKRSEVKRQSLPVESKVALTARWPSPVLGEARFNPFVDRSKEIVSLPVAESLPPPPEPPKRSPPPFSYRFAGDFVNIDGSHAYYIERNGSLIEAKVGLELDDHYVITLVTENLIEFGWGEEDRKQLPIKKE